MVLIPETNATVSVSIFHSDNGFLAHRIQSPVSTF